MPMPMRMWPMVSTTCICRHTHPNYTYNHMLSLLHSNISFRSYLVSDKLVQYEVRAPKMYCHACLSLYARVTQCEFVFVYIYDTECACS